MKIAIKELENLMQWAVVITRDEYITSDDRHFPSSSLPSSSDKKPFGALRESPEDLEKQLIDEAMKKSGNNQTKAAELLGIS